MSSTSSTPRIRVLLADDHAAIRSGLRLMLGAQPDIEVVGEAGNGSVAVSQARALRPDVVLMDIRMPGMDGIAATAEITAAGLADVLVLTAFEIDEYVYAALRAGAAGFLLKSVEAPTLVDAIRRVAGGEGVLAPEVTRLVLTRFATAEPDQVVDPDPERAARLESLTAREREVLDCLGDGLSNAGIAARLKITETTAKTHVSRVLAKLGCTSRVQAAILAQHR